MRLARDWPETGKKIDAPPRPRTFSKYQTQPPTSQFLFFLPFILVRFWAFLGLGFKNTTDIIFIKSPCRKLFPKKSAKISMSVFPRLFWVYSGFGGFAAMGV
jgi:hypothetical protein